MFSVLLLTITTLNWIQVGIGVNHELFCLSCFLYELTSDTLGARYANNKNTVTWRNCCLNIGDTDQRRTNCVLTMHLNFSKSCLHKDKAFGNCEIPSSVSRTVQVQFGCPSQQKRYAKINCSLFEAHTKTNRRRMCRFISVIFGNSLYDVRIMSLNLVKGCLGRVISEEVTTEIRSLVVICTQCNVRSRGSADRVEVSFGRTPGRVFFTRKRILIEKKLRKRRHILGNTSSANAFSTFFSPYATGISPMITPTIVTNVWQSTPSPQQRFVFCPQSAVINSSTIVLVKPSGHFKGTLVPTTKLTPLLRVVDIVQSAPSTLFTRVSIQATTPFGALVNATASSRDRSQLRTSTIDAKFIYSSRLVSIMYNASNSSFAFITTWNCATVTGGHASSASLDPAPTNASPSQTKSHKMMKWVVGLTIAGGTVSGFVLIAVLTVFIRRYRRARGIRRKAKQISYFNRYDGSAAWEEPFGGSRLSVFTLKNSKFDIDWETPNDAKRIEPKEDEDFEGT